MRLWKKVIAATAAVGTVVFFFMAVDVGPHEEYSPDPVETAVVDTVPLPPNAYGIPISGFTMEQGSIKAGSTFGELLA